MNFILMEVFYVLIMVLILINMIFIE